MCRSYVSSVIQWRKKFTSCLFGPSCAFVLVLIHFFASLPESCSTNVATSLMLLDICFDPPKLKFVYIPLPTVDTLLVPCKERCVKTLLQELTTVPCIIQTHIRAHCMGKIRRKNFLMSTNVLAGAIVTVVIRRLNTGCNRRNVRDFGRVFLMLNYTDITQNTYIQS